MKQVLGVNNNDQDQIDRGRPFIRIYDNVPNLSTFAGSEALSRSGRY